MSILLTANQPLLTDWIMVAITIIYVIATIVICIFNGKSAKAANKQIEEMKTQQKQNAGIQLYSMRKDILKAFSQKKYDEIYWDSVLLFSEEIPKDILKVSKLENSFQVKNTLLKEYESLMHESDSELYEDFFELSNKLELVNPDDAGYDKLLKELFDLCQGFNPIYKNPVDDSEEILNYQSLYMERNDLEIKAKAEHIRIFLKIQQEIKDSISE